MEDYSRFMIMQTSCSEKEVYWKLLKIISDGIIKGRFWFLFVMNNCHVVKVRETQWRGFELVIMSAEFAYNVGIFCMVSVSIALKCCSQFFHHDV